MIKRWLEAATKKRDFTAGKISTNIWILALPVIFGNLLQTAFNVVDMFWVGRLGPDAIAAVAMSGTILMIVMFFMIGVGTGTTAMIARFIGAKDQELADNTAMQSLTMSLIISAVLSVIGYFLSPWMMRVLGASPTVLELGSIYMQITFIGIFIMFFSFLISAILYGAGDTITPLIILGVATILNIVLDPLMIFGVWPFPAMGVAGAAWATVIARALASLMALEVIFRGRSRVHVRLSEYRLDLGLMWRILKIGIPSSAQMSLRGFMNVFLMSFVAAFGTMAVAAYGIGVRIEMIVLMPGFGFASAASTLVGQNLGARNIERARKSAWHSTLYYILLNVVLTILIFTFARQLILIFNNDPEVVKIGTQYLKISSLTYVFVSVALILNRSLVGAGDTMSAMLITFIGLWVVLVPLAWYLSKFTPLGLLGIWIAIVAAIVVQAVLNVICFEAGGWQSKKV
ncbi:MAG: MATE family efflux transporter [Candidatus Margulisbacteria bacterium]|nr:MATE family efflux transporter [Candidatus Margulisiibacteriota bacterium]